MERVVESYGESYLAVVLYLDDLNEMVEILKEVSKDVNIVMGGYKLNGLPEARQVGREVTFSCELTAHRPFIAVHLAPDDVRLFIEKDDVVSRGAFEKIRAILRGRRAPFAWLSNSHWVAWGLTIPAAGFWWALFSGLEQRNSYSILLGLIGVVFYFGLVRWGFILDRKRHTIIHLRRRVEVPSFWQRNKDKIIVGTSLSLIGLIIGKLWR
jgi:hypothetical protein